VDVCGYVTSSQALNGAVSQDLSDRGACLASKSPQVLRKGPYGMARWKNPIRLWSWGKVWYDSLLSLVFLGRWPLLFSQEWWGGI
jgi:hypothetical protein